MILLTFLQPQFHNDNNNNNNSNKSNNNSENKKFIYMHQMQSNQTTNIGKLYLTILS